MRAKFDIQNPMDMTYVDSVTYLIDLVNFINKNIIVIKKSDMLNFVYGVNHKYDTRLILNKENADDIFYSIVKDGKIVDMKQEILESGKVALLNKLVRMYINQHSYSEIMSYAKLLFQEEYLYV